MTKNTVLLFVFEKILQSFLPTLKDRFCLTGYWEFRRQKSLVFYCEELKMSIMQGFGSQLISNEVGTDIAAPSRSDIQELGSIESFM